MRLTRTQEDVEEYGSLESAMYGRTVDAEKVCMESVCIEFKCLVSIKLELNSFRALTQAHAMSVLQGYQNQVKESSYRSVGEGIYRTILDEVTC